MNKGLVALAAGTFALGIAEFAMMGILGDVAKAMDISIAKAGHLISAYSTGVAIGAPALILLRRMPLKKLMLLLAAFIVIGNTLASVAPSYHFLLAARFISGLPHGAYFGAGAIVCSRLAANGKGASAVATLVGGMTLANVVGVPSATFICNILSWRTAFAVVAIAGLVAYTGIRIYLPKLAPLPDTGVKGQFRFLRHYQPWLIYAGVFFGQASVYCWFSYIEPVMTQVAGFSTADMTPIMVLAGCGMVFGNFAAGKLADRFNPIIVPAWIAAAIILIMPAIYFFVHVKIVLLILTFLSTAGLFGIGGPLQFIIVRYARGGEMLGGAGIQIAFNVSNAMSAAIGGAVIHAGLGYAAPAVVGIPFAVIGAAALFILDRRSRHDVD